jgi:hypothetical protein
MNHGRTVFAQLMDFLPYKTFERYVQRYQGEHRVRSFSCWDQFLSLAFAQITGCRSLRAIDVSLNALPGRLYHLGIRGHVSRSTLADANESRDWRIFADFGKELIRITRQAYANSRLALDLDRAAYILDSTTIDLCLSLFPWADFRMTKAAIKVHTLLDLQSSIPTFLRITAGRVHDIQMLDKIPIESGAIYVLDRAYFDAERLFRLHQWAAFFVIRAKKNLRFRRLYSKATDRSTGVFCDQWIRFDVARTRRLYPERLRRILFYDEERDRHLTFLTNNFVLPPLTIAQLYKNRWQVETFFKWIKSNLQIERFYGTSVNAVKLQIWVAITVYVLAARVKKQLNLPHSLHEILQILKVTVFEKVPLGEALTKVELKDNRDAPCNSQKSFKFQPDSTDLKCVFRVQFSIITMWEEEVVSDSG